MVIRFILLSLFLFGCSSTPRQFSNAPVFQWPLKSGKITQNFKHSSDRHDGVDISGKKGTPIHSASSGYVIYAGSGFSGYGKLVIIEHQGDTWASFYAHLNAIHVREGQKVFQGTPIGTMGRTGRATGVHLHFEIRHNLRPVNPLSYLKSTQNGRVLR